MYSYAPIGLSNQIHGSQTWQVVSATGIKPPFDATISVTRIDTVHNSLKNFANNIDTVFVTQTRTSFTVSARFDAITVRWSGLTLEAPGDSAALERVPRGVPEGADPFVVYLPGGNGRATYGRGIGLTSWRCLIGGINFWYEELTLVSFSEN